MPGRSTTEAIHLLRSLMEKYRERQRDLHMVFLDMEKAYNSVSRQLVWKTLIDKGTPRRYLKVIQDMYEGAKTRIVTGLIKMNIPWCNDICRHINARRKSRQKLNNTDLRVEEGTKEDNGLRHQLCEWLAVVETEARSFVLNYGLIKGLSVHRMLERTGEACRAIELLRGLTLRRCSIVMYNDELDHVTMSFARSGGPGGQNGNKGQNVKMSPTLQTFPFFIPRSTLSILFAVNTKVDMRFNVSAAHWLSGRVREKILQTVTVMIMSLKAASLRLNMVAACYVILLDLWWNPTTEDQAIDRARQIRQTHPVTMKREMVESVFGDDKNGGCETRLTVADMEYLFQA
ncbi:retrovirus-related pol polyprotein LINE-1 [Tanacetum coccineum]